MKIDVLYHAPITPLEQTESGDWIDLRSAEIVTINPGEKAKVCLGVSMKLPEDHEANIVPRSSLFKTFRVIQTNSMGVIDNVYCGPNDIWFVELFNPTSEPATIPFDARICQFRIMKKMPKVELNTVYSLNYPDRGGHGASGIM